MTDFRTSPTLEPRLRITALVAGAILLAGLFLSPARAWSNLLIAAYGLMGVGLAGLVFVAIAYASGAAWCVAFRRVPEAAAAIIPYGGAALLLVLLFGSSLYPWTHEPMHGFKHTWLNWAFVLARAVLFAGAWILFAQAITRASRAQDQDGLLTHTHRNARLSVAFLFVFGLTFWLASFDWIMSLEPHWASTIFGIYNFAGLFSSGLAALVLLVIWMQKQETLRDFVTPEHLHDLGKLLFAFSTFWMYIWFSQYMLIWYANITEESVYYIRRTQGAWGPLFVLNILLNWAVPFLALLPRGVKRGAGLLGIIALVALVGRWLDLYLLITPATIPGVPRFGIWEIAAAAGAVALFLLVFLRAIRSAPPVPLRDPRLAESLHYHN
jgi:hypothetical protein